MFLEFPSETSDKFRSSLKKLPAIENTKEKKMEELRDISSRIPYDRSGVNYSTPVVSSLVRLANVSSR
jgi:hypothetical protein